jgi:hypothetical protein
MTLTTRYVQVRVNVGIQTIVYIPFKARCSIHYIFLPPEVNQDAAEEEGS